MKNTGGLVITEEEARKVNEEIADSYLSAFFDAHRLVLKYDSAMGGLVHCIRHQVGGVRVDYYKQVQKIIGEINYWPRYINHMKNNHGAWLGCTECHGEGK